MQKLSVAFDMLVYICPKNKNYVALDPRMMTFIKINQNVAQKMTYLGTKKDQEGQKKNQN